MDQQGRQPGWGRGVRPARALLTLCLLLAALALGGCAKVTFGSTFREQGGATHTLTVVVERSGVLPQDLPRLERELADAIARAEADGFSVARIDTATQLGLHVSSTTTETTDVAAALNSLFNSIAVPDDAPPVAPFQGTFEPEGEALGGAAWELDLTVDGALLAESLRALEPGNLQLATDAGLAEAATFVYVATLPGKIKETTGRQEGESTVRWTIPLAGTTALQARSATSEPTPWGWIVAVSIAAAALVAALGAGVVTLLLRRRRGVVQRLPLTLHVRAAEARAAGLPVVPQPETLSQVGQVLRRVVGRLLRGERVSVQARPEERQDGTHPQGD